MQKKEKNIKTSSRMYSEKIYLTHSLEASLERTLIKRYVTSIPGLQSATNEQEPQYRLSLKENSLILTTSKDHPLMDLLHTYPGKDTGDDTIFKDLKRMLDTFDATSPLIFTTSSKEFGMMEIYTFLNQLSLMPTFERFELLENLPSSIDYPDIKTKAEKYTQFMDEMVPVVIVDAIKKNLGHIMLANESSKLRNVSVAFAGFKSSSFVGKKIMRTFHTSLRHFFVQNEIRRRNLIRLFKEQGCNLVSITASDDNESFLVEFSIEQ